VRVGCDERAGAEQAELLAVGEQEQHVVRERRTGLERAQGLEQHRHGVAVVARARSGRDRVVVADQQQGASRAAAARQAGHDVLDVVELELRLGLVLRNGRALDLRRHAEPRHFGHDVVADDVVLGGADRMRRAGDAADMAERPRGGELAGGRVVGARRRRLELREREHDRDAGREQHGEASLHGHARGHARGPGRMSTGRGHRNIHDSLSWKTSSDGPRSSAGIARRLSEASEWNRSLLTAPWV
jgi:hypothetical protein